MKEELLELFRTHIHTVAGRMMIVESMRRPFNEAMKNGPEKFGRIFQNMLIGALQIKSKASEYENFSGSLRRFYGEPENIDRFIIILSEYAEAPEVAFVMLA